MQPRADLDNASVGGRPELLLFLCVANVCRSPAMQLLTARGLEELGVGMSWRFASAGTSVSARMQMCTSSASYVADLPGGAEFARKHRSRSIDRDLVEQAGMILVTSQRERSVVARLSPSARARSFTMIEAALLAGKAASRANDAWPGAAATGEPTTLQSLVTAMHHSRGMLRPREAAAPTRGLFSRHRAAGHLGIDDAHSGVRKRHGPVLADLRWASDHLAQAFAQIAGPPPGS